MASAFWNYRVIKNAQGQLELREAFYDEGDSPNAHPRFFSSCKPLSLKAESEEELRWHLQAMLASLSFPVLSHKKRKKTIRQTA
jgi:hypothetical protein